MCIKLGNDNLLKLFKKRRNNKGCFYFKLSNGNGPVNIQDQKELRANEETHNQWAREKRIV